MRAAERQGSYGRIYRVVMRIPRGRVATYGQISSLAGIPSHARQVGYALFSLDCDDVPWHRVVNSRGEVSPRARPGGDRIQRQFLESEGVAFDSRGRIDLERFRWRPRSRTRF